MGNRVNPRREILAELMLQQVSSAPPLLATHCCCYTINMEKKIRERSVNENRMKRKHMGYAQTITGNRRCCLVLRFQSLNTDENMKWGQKKKRIPFVLSPSLTRSHISPNMPPCIITQLCILLFFLLIPFSSSSSSSSSSLKTPMNTYYQKT